MNERMINYFKDEKNHQQALYNKYFTLNNEVKTKIKKINENLPSYEKKIKSKMNKLKDCKLIFSLKIVSIIFPKYLLNN